MRIWNWSLINLPSWGIPPTTVDDEGLLRGSESVVVDLLLPPLPWDRFYKKRTKQ